MLGMHGCRLQITTLLLLDHPGPRGDTLLQAQAISDSTLASAKNAALLLQEPCMIAMTWTAAASHAWLALSSRAAVASAVGRSLAAYVIQLWM